MFQHIIH